LAAESSPQRPFLQRLILSAALAVLGASLLFCIDFAAMRTLYRAERILLEDVTHFPTFSSELANTNPELNSDFIRDTREASAFPAEATNLVVLGDSFAYGFRVWPQEALPLRLQERARERHPERAINVANFGWVSSSPYLSHKVLQSIGAKYHPDLVVMMVDMTDIHDDIVYEKYAEKPGVFAALSVLPSAVLAAKDVARHAGTHERWFGYPAERFFHIERPLSETRPYFDAYLRKNLDALNHYVTAKFLVVGRAALLPVQPPRGSYGLGALGARARQPVLARAVSLVRRAERASRLPGLLAARHLSTDEAVPDDVLRRPALEPRGP
jgi:hypothetical protein